MDTTSLSSREEERPIIDISPVHSDNDKSSYSPPIPAHSSAAYSQSQGSNNPNKNVLSQSQSLYSGLLSSPEFHIFDYSREGSSCGQIVRSVKTSESFQPYTLQDFLKNGPQPRTARGNRTRNKETKLSSSRQMRTFQSRLKEYLPILQNKMERLPSWRKCPMAQNIQSISSMTILDENNESAVFGWDHEQGIAFKEFETPMVLIGYIVKKTLPDREKLMNLCSEIGVIPIPLKSKRDSCLYLEDETARVRLGLTKQQIENINFNEVVSGIPVAIKGTSSNGKFWIEDVLYPTPAAPDWPIVPQGDAVEIVFVSGLNFDAESKSLSHFDLLFDYLQGLSGSVVEQDKILRSKTRVFFVGNNLSKERKRSHEYDKDMAQTMLKTYAKNVLQLDSFLENVSRTMEVFIMPGEDDLTHQQALPQPPFHRQLFPECADRPTFQRLTNPAKVSVSLSKPECSVDLHESIVIEDHVVNMILTSGTNVKETMNSCEIQCPMEMSRKLLEWSHLLPTSVQDNRLAEELYSLKGTLPHLFVVGGLCEYGCETWNDVKIVGVPSFAETGTVAILTKDCEIVPLSFKICNFPLDL